MLGKLARTEDRFLEIEKALSDSDIVGNQEEYKKLMKEYKTLSPIIEKYREYKKAESEMEDANLAKLKAVMAEYGLL